MENNYGYFVSYIYAQERFSFDFFTPSFSNSIGNAFTSYNKKLEDFLLEDYNKIKEIIAEKLCEQLNEKQKEFHDKYNSDKEYEYKDDLVSIDSIMIINIIPKKYEVFNNEENN